MIVCKVIGHVWATKKDPNLEGLKLMVVQEEDPVSKKPQTYVAADIVGAGIGEQVLVVSGSTARRAFGRDDVPADMAIVGIIDTIEVERAAKEKSAK
ncbi:MAG: EutN/CcmL family microcompartment protein [Clostridia bacterium]|nr:EutN/CcmL family microcompartment protein [Clostridia bacterium]